MKFLLFQYKTHFNRHINNMMEKMPDSFQNPEEKEYQNKPQEKQEKQKLSLEEYAQQRQERFNAHKEKDSHTSAEKRFIDTFPPKDGSPDDPWSSVFGKDPESSGGNEIDTNNRINESFQNEGADEFIKNPDKTIETEVKEENMATDINISATDGAESKIENQPFTNQEIQNEEQSQNIIEKTFDTIKGHSDKITDTTQ